MPELTLVEAINDCLHVELARDGDVLVMGEDVGRSGGVFRATAGLRDRFGADRCVDTPLAEAVEALRSGIKAAEAEPPADVGLVFEHAYAAPPASFAAELAELRELLGG